MCRKALLKENQIRSTIPLYPYTGLIFHLERVGCVSYIPDWLASALTPPLIFKVFFYTGPAGSV